MEFYDGSTTCITGCLIGGPGHGEKFMASYAPDATNIGEASYVRIGVCQNGEYLYVEA